MDRIEYEEWALKAVDPALGPSLNPVKKSEGQELKDVKPEEVREISMSGEKAGGLARKADVAL